MPEINYLDTGFDVFLQREVVKPKEGDALGQLLPQDKVDTLIEGISGSKITSGISRSKDGSFRIDWDKGVLEFFDGTGKSIQIGKFDDGTSGIRTLPTRGSLFSQSMIEVVLAPAPAPGIAGTARLYVDNGGPSGKARLMVQFNSGNPRTIATQP